ncbi:MULTISPECIES: hypothetical protein [unclassified Pseudodesulfovibrio]|uniref:hypothetical protein n=1 Tax=unclassified Pseudodesulfovibrio TaxID=2661612 RepID=UPI000FEBD1D8|nr:MULTISPECIES: hypothetical protein [unclassified Pseudodesulfovibrio]MCJ2166014.1 hypothetical protein [Pseudodesulfovibrio sp. S3-i]RWU02547.1 hypothetical protein DWB63_15715 [Pseudodesulfovibrio sp. S3]
MPELIYALICSDLIIDKDSSSTSFIRTIEHAVVPGLPAALPPVYFASLWDMESNGDAPFTISLTLIPPKGDSVTLGIQEVAPSGTMLHKMNFHLPGLHVEDEGKHILSVTLKKGSQWETKARLPLYVFKSTSH